MDKIAVLIPCYNEGTTIQKVVRDWKAALPEATVYVYDNNSSDATADLARASGATVRHEYLQGKGNVVRKMFREIDAQCYIMVDGDDTYPAEAGPKMVEEVLKNHADMVIGDRLSSTYFAENKRAFHNIGNAATRFVVNQMFHADIKDLMSGLRAFSFQFVKTFPVLSKGFEIETEMTIHAVDKNMYIKHCVIDYRNRPAGSESKLNTIPDGIRVIGTILKLFKNLRPLQLFSAVAMVLFVLSAVFFVPILIDYLKTGIVLKIPTLIVCGFAAIAAMLSFFSGIVLQTMKQSDRQAFEFRLQTVRMMQQKGDEYTYDAVPEV